MSRINLIDCETKTLDNYVKTESLSNLPDIRDPRNLPNMPEFNNRGHNTQSNFMENHIHPNIYKICENETDFKNTRPNPDVKKLMNKTAEDEKLGLLPKTIETNNVLIYEALRSDMSDHNDSEPIPQIEIHKQNKSLNAINNSQNSIDQFRDSFPQHQMPHRVYVTDTQKIHKFQHFNQNGYGGNRMKTTNSSGSSFVKCSQPHYMYVHNADCIETDEFSHCNAIKKPNLYFSHLSESNINDDSQQSAGNFSKITSSEDSNNKPAFCNSSQLYINSEVNHKEAILIQQPEIYDSESYPSIMEVHFQKCGGHRSTDYVESNSSTLVKNGMASEYIHPGNCYGQTFTINRIHENIPQYGPIGMVPVQVNSHFRNMNCYSQSHFIPMNSNYSTDKPKHRSATLPEVKIPVPEVSESFTSKPDLLDNPQPYFVTEPVDSHPKPQQFSSNNELHRINNYSSMSLTNTIIPNIPVKQAVTLDSVQQNQIVHESNSILDQTVTANVSTDRELSNPVKKIGKFMVTPVQNNIDPTPVFKSTENVENNGNYNANIPSDANDDIPKLDRPQQHSRFKKTRIRETIERWYMNGLNTYDCRFKIIPSKIMSLYNSKPEYLSKDMGVNQNCTKCGTHDREKYCQDANYHKKDFKFWHSGNRVDDLCTELEQDVENYCHFHAKILKLLNQNQNLSLSKYSSNSTELSENANISSPQLFQTVLISSPERDNYFINIDSQPSHVLLSAPPVSPSAMNTVSISNLPPNIQSPRSATTMVMLTRAKPVLLSNAARTTPLLNESITIEKINHGKPSNIDLSGTNLCGQQILANDSFWTPGSVKSDQLTYKLASPTYVAGTVIADSSNINGQICKHQPSIYSFEQMTSLYYPIYHSVPSVSSTTITNKSHDPNSILSQIEECSQSDDASVEFTEEINKQTNNFKSVITEMFQKEQKKLLGEIKILKVSNEQLTADVSKLKCRCDKLELLLKEKQCLSSECVMNELDGAVEQLAKTANCATISRSPKSSPECQRSDFDCYNLI